MAASLTKQKKPSNTTNNNNNNNNNNMYVYKLGCGTPEHHPTMVTKRVVSISKVWGLGKSKSSKDIEERKAVPLPGVEMKLGRKSVSDVESCGLALGEDFPEAARKSVSNVDRCGIRYDIGRKKGVELGRKSVGHAAESENLGAEMALQQVKVLVTDMPGFMQVQAFRCARRTYDSLEKFSAKHLAYNLKKEFDKVYGPAWHCIVGSSFGSFVTHSTGCFLYFSMQRLYILLFKTKVQKALE